MKNKIKTLKIYRNIFWQDICIYIKRHPIHVFKRVSRAKNEILEWWEGQLEYISNEIENLNL